MISCTDEKGAYEVISRDQLETFKVFLLADTDKSEQLLALHEEANPIIFYYEFKDKK